MCVCVEGGSTNNAKWGGSDGELLDTTTLQALTAVLKHVSAPAMPTVKTDQEHLYKYVHSQLTNLTALLSRPVPSNELTDHR